jgi:hypothetical protein
VEVKPVLTYLVNLNHQEFRLVGLALAGKLKPDSKEARDAQELNQKMLAVRHAYLTDLQTSQGILDHALNTEGELPNDRS